MEAGKEALQERHDVERPRYVRGEITFQEFYTWLAGEIGIADHHVPATLDRLRESEDSYLNDIPIRSWDGQDFAIRQLAHSAGMRVWALSDTVCCLKAHARKMIGVML